MECNGQSCSSNSGINSSHKESDSCGEDRCLGSSCDCPSCSGQDVLKFAEIMWHKAAMAAMFEIKKDKIKSRLEKSFGPTLDKGADVVVEAISNKIGSAIKGAKSEKELRSKLASIMTEAVN